MVAEISSNEAGPASRRRSPPWKWLLALAVILVVAFGLHHHRYGVNRLADEALAGETGAQTEVHRRDWIGGNDLVFNIVSADGEMSMADMTRRFLKTAEALKDSQFDKVYLAYQGNEKFYLEGDYFQQLGREREFQNPVYTIRTLPEHLFRPDGTAAFGTWTGGWLGVMGKQLEDSSEFHKQWWVNDALGDFQP